MEIPVVIGGETVGKAVLAREGGLIVYRVELRDVSRVLRLWVHGERCAYLGIPVPEQGVMRLVRRVSPRERVMFPQRPEYVSDEEKPAQRPESARGVHVVWQGGKPYYF